MTEDGSGRRVPTGRQDWLFLLVFDKPAAVELLRRAYALVLDGQSMGEAFADCGLGSSAVSFMRSEFGDLHGLAHQVASRRAGVKSAHSAGMEVNEERIRRLEQSEAALLDALTGPLVEDMVGRVAAGVAKATPDPSVDPRYLPLSSPLPQGRDEGGPLFVFWVREGEGNGAREVLVAAHGEKEAVRIAAQECAYSAAQARATPARFIARPGRRRSLWLGVLDDTEMEYWTGFRACDVCGHNHDPEAPLCDRSGGGSGGQLAPNETAPDHAPNDMLAPPSSAVAARLDDAPTAPEESPFRRRIRRGSILVAVRVEGSRVAVADIAVSGDVTDVEVAVAAAEIRRRLDELLGEGGAA